MPLFAKKKLRTLALTLITSVLVTILGVTCLQWLHDPGLLPNCANVTQINGIYQEPCIIPLGPD